MTQMDMSKLTPGPWKVKPLQSTQGADMAICAPSNGWVVAVIQHDPDIQTVDDPDGDTVVWHDADHANARAIAQVPAMVAALRDAYTILDGLTHPGCRKDGDYMDRLGKLLAAIDGEA